NHATVFIEFQALAILFREPCGTGEEDQAGPALAIARRKLGDGERTIRIGAEPVGVSLDGFRATLGDARATFGGIDGDGRRDDDGLVIFGTRHALGLGDDDLAWASEAGLERARGVRVYAHVAGTD